MEQYCGNLTLFIAVYIANLNFNNYSPTQIGRPTLDSLFVNPTSEGVVYKIFNTNTYGGVVGAFNVSLLLA